MATKTELQEKLAKAETRAYELETFLEGMRTATLESVRAMDNVRDTARVLTEAKLSAEAHRKDLVTLLRKCAGLTDEGVGLFELGVKSAMGSDREAAVAMATALRAEVIDLCIQIDNERDKGG